MRYLRVRTCWCSPTLLINYLTGTESIGKEIPQNFWSSGPGGKPRGPPPPPTGQWCAARRVGRATTARDRRPTVGIHRWLLGTAVTDWWLIAGFTCCCIRGYVRNLEIPKFLRCLAALKYVALKCLQFFVINRITVGGGFVWSKYSAWCYNVT